MTYRLQRTLPVTLNDATAEARVIEFRTERDSGNCTLTVTIGTKWLDGKYTSPFMRELDTLWGTSRQYGRPLPYVLVGFAEGDVKAAIQDLGFGEPRLGGLEETAKIVLLLVGVPSHGFMVDDAEWDIDDSQAPNLVIRPKGRTVAEIDIPNVPLSQEVIDLLVGDLPPTPPKQLATFTYAEDDRRECPECSGVVEAVQIVGDAAVSTGAGVASVSITSDVVTCLPCGHEVRR